MKLLVTLPPRLDSFVRQEVATGQFRSMEEAIQYAVRLHEVVRRDRQIKAAWRQEEKRFSGATPSPLTTTETTGRFFAEC